MINKQVFLASHLSFFIERLGYKLPDNWVIQLLAHSDTNVCNQIKADYKEQGLALTPENFIFYSECIFADIEKKDGGITFTPAKVANQMAQLAFSQIKESTELGDLRIVDPAVGGGILLISIARHLFEISSSPMQHVVENNLYGMDIVEENILLTKIAMTLLCLESSANTPNHFNMTVGDSFKISQELFGRFDIVVVNPPYIRSKNLSGELKEYIRSHFKTAHGMLDTYIPFFEISMNLLKAGGSAVLITPNSYLTSLNGERLRKYLTDNSSVIKLINFNNQRLFKGVSSYSAITGIVKKTAANDVCEIKYLLSPTDNNVTNNNPVDWQPVNQKEVWRTLNDVELGIIHKIETAFGTTLSKLDFKGGIATQRDSLYSFLAISETDSTFCFSSASKTYSIEKALVMAHIKPNQKEHTKNQKMIFPYQYDNNSKRFEAIPEDRMQVDYPLAYQYLLDQKEELSLRAYDKKMPYWYSYGRSQGLSSFGSRIYLPYIAKTTHTTVSDGEGEVFSSGSAIFHDDTDYLHNLGHIFGSALFSYYIAMVSKPYTGGYYSTSKNMIKLFSVPSVEECDVLENRPLTDNDIFSLYRLTKKEITALMSVVG